jgi:la-related protein 1
MERDKTKSKTTPQKKKTEEKREREHFEERKDSDFQFDEELDGSLPSGRYNTFTDWSEDESDYEISDREIIKLLTVTRLRHSHHATQNTRGIIAQVTGPPE